MNFYDWVKTNGWKWGEHSEAFARRAFEAGRDSQPSKSAPIGLESATISTLDELIIRYGNARRSEGEASSHTAWKTNRQQAEIFLEEIRNLLAAHPVTKAASADESDALPMELRDVAEALAEGDGHWRECSGCFETEDGHPVGHFPYSAVFKCNLGGGCSECGGIGAVWDNTDYGAMADDMTRSLTAQPAPNAASDGVATFGSHEQREAFDAWWLDGTYGFRPCDIYEANDVVEDYAFELFKEGWHALAKMLADRASTPNSDSAKEGA